MAATAAPEDIGTTADNLRMGALSDRVLVVRVVLRGILGTAAVSPKVPDSDFIVCLELVFIVIGGDGTTAVQLWVEFCFILENSSKVSTGFNIREGGNELGPSIGNEVWKAKGGTEPELCPVSHSLSNPGALPVKGAAPIKLGFAPASCHDIV